MTCREKYNKEHPNSSTTIACPSDAGYLDDPVWCGDEDSNMSCRECWDREIPEEKKTIVPPRKRMPEDYVNNPEPAILDSGDRTNFESGAVRDMRKGKGRCDLMPLEVVAAYICENDDETDWVLWSIREFQKTNHASFLYSALNKFDEKCWDNCYTMMLEVAKHYEEGAEKYGENNWQKGLPTRCYVDSAVRHYLKWLRGDKDEPHDRAFVWNILCCIWTCEMMPEQNSYQKDGNEA